MYKAAKTKSNLMEKAHYYADEVIPFMEKTRAIADQIEPLWGMEFRPYPTYEELLFANEGYEHK